MPLLKRIHPLFWLLLPPMVAVVAGLYTFYLAQSHKDSMVVDDYYQEGKLIEKVWKRDHTAVQLQLRADMQILHDVIWIKLNSTQNNPHTLKLNILHPVHQELDQHLNLEQVAPGMYRALLSQRPEMPKWYLQLEAPDWRLVGELDKNHPDATTLHPETHG